MESPDVISPGASFAIKRRPVSVCHRKPLHQTSPISPVPSPGNLHSAPLLEFEDVASQNFPQQPSADVSAQAEILGASIAESISIPTPPPSAGPMPLQTGQQPGDPGMYFAPPPSSSPGQQPGDPGMYFAPPPTSSPRPLQNGQQSDGGGTAFPPPPAISALPSQTGQLPSDPGMYFPPPPSSSPRPLQAGQQVDVTSMYFPPPPNNTLPTPPPSVEASPQPYIPQPAPATAPAPPVSGRPAATTMPGYTPTPSLNQPPHQGYNPAQINSNLAQPPQQGYNPAQISSTLTQPQNLGYIPSQVNTPLAQVPGPSRLPTASPAAGTGLGSGGPLTPTADLKRLSTWSKEAANKYWNKETAKKAYKNSKEFLVKTNDKLGKVIDPLMPVIAVAHPNLAAAYQVAQVSSQAMAAKNNAIQGKLAAGAPLNGAAIAPSNQDSSGVNNIALLSSALAQVAVNNSDNNSAEVNPYLAALNQQGTNPYNTGFDQNAYLAALTQNGGTDTNAILAAMNQSAITTPDFGTDPSAYLAALTQNGTTDANTAAITAYIQQQGNAAAASALASMTTQDSTFQAALPGIMAAAQSSQDFSTQLMNSLMEQQQVAQTEALANLANFELQSANTGAQVPVDTGYVQPDSSMPGGGSQGAAFDPTFGAQPPQGQSQGPQFSGPSTTQPQGQAQNPQPSGPAAAQPQGQGQGPQSSIPAASQPQPTTNTSTAEAPVWVRHRVPMFGLSEIAFPPKSNIRPVGHNFLVGLLEPLSGHFEIKLLYTGAQVLSDMASTQSLQTDDDMTVIEPCLMIDFGIPCGGISVAHAIRINDADEDGVFQSMYKAIIQSPHGHGLEISFIVPAHNLNTAKLVAKNMISSIKWLDRATISTNAADKVLGKWRYEDETFLIDLGDESNSEKKELTFTSDGRYKYERSGGRKEPVPEGEATAPDQTSGQFVLYEYADRAIHLLLIDDSTKHVEVQAVELGENVLVVKGKKYIRIAV